MVAATFASVIWWTLGYLLLGVVLFLLGTRGLSELRICGRGRLAGDHAATAAGPSPSGSEASSGYPKGSSGFALGVDASSQIHETRRPLGGFN